MQDNVLDSMHTIVRNSVISQINFIKLPALERIRKSDDRIDAQSQRVQVQIRAVFYIPPQELFFEQFCIFDYEKE